MQNINWNSWERQFEHFLDRQMQGADAAHDREHIRRVVANARALAAEEDAELAVVLPAAWLHDCVTVPKSAPERSAASRLAAQAACAFLREAGYPEECLSAIAHAIEAHSFSAQIAAETLEARVVQDADRLDAIGAIGVARCLMLGGALGKQLYQPADPFLSHSAPDDSRYVIDHFYQKLLLLPELMATAAGRRAAAQRAAFLHAFLDQLRSELGR